MNIIFAVCSWGLGHATRSLPIIRKLLKEDHSLTIISDGRALEVLKKELVSFSNVKYKDIPDYPMLLSENARQFMAKSLVYWPLFIHRIESGLQQLQRILRKNRYDCIFSDARYDMYNKKIPSFFMSHQMRIMNPLRISMFETISEWYNKFFFKRFVDVIIPDFEIDSLSGDLSHNLKRINEKKLHYVGVLSDFAKEEKKKDIDYLISITGPEPQRSYLEETLLSQIEYLTGTIVVTLGKSEKNHKQSQENVLFYSFVGKKQREDLLNRSKMVVSRSGYSTIMDLAVIGTKALLIPTPGQIEQEYLGKYHTLKKTFYSKPQSKVDLVSDIQKTKKQQVYK